MKTEIRFITKNAEMTLISAIVNHIIPYFCPDVFHCNKNYYIHIYVLQNYIEAN